MRTCPDDCKVDYEEARKVLEDSPRAAAALLRLATEKLCRLPTVQKALDTLRVIGNESVHPGTMDIRDDTDVALHLFGLVAIVVEQTITQPKKIAALYGTLPPGAIAGIKQRDGS
jgi:hypothetical protein